MINKKYIFIDIDGTLRNELDEITANTKKSLKRVINLGHEIIITTGRPLDYAKKLNVHQQIIIYNNGGGIFDIKNNKVICEFGMDKKSIQYLYNLAKKNNVRCVFATNQTRFVEKIKYYDGTESLIEENITDFINNNEIISITLTDDNYLNIKKLRDDILKDKHVKIVNQSRILTDLHFKQEGSAYCDIVDINTSKGNAIKYFCNIYNINKDKTISIGDDINDISMFENTGYGVAMGNAMPIVKEMSDYITLDNDNEGVSAFLNTLN